MISKVIKELLDKREFISVATCDLDARPNAAPKFLLKVDGSCIYLVDHIIGKTFRNLKANPQASISFFDNDALTGYQLNGNVEIIDGGAEYREALDYLQRKEIDLATARVIEGVIKGQPHKAYEVAAAKKFVVLKIKVEEIVCIQSTGTLQREEV